MDLLRRIKSDNIKKSEFEKSSSLLSDPFSCKQLISQDNFYQDDQINNKNENDDLNVKLIN